MRAASARRYSLSAMGWLLRNNSSNSDAMIFSPATDWLAPADPPEGDMAGVAGGGNPQGKIPVQHAAKPPGVQPLLSGLVLHFHGSRLGGGRPPPPRFTPSHNS